MNQLASMLSRIQDRQRAARHTEWIQEETRARIHLMPEVERLLNATFGPLNPDGTGRGSECRIDRGPEAAPDLPGAAPSPEDIALCVTLHQKDLEGLTPERIAILVEAAGEEAGMSYDSTDDEVTFTIATCNRSTREVTEWASRLLEAARSPLGAPQGEPRPTSLRREPRLKGDAPLTPEGLFRDLEDRLNLLAANTSTPSIRTAPEPRDPLRLAGVQRGIVAFQEAKKEAERCHPQPNPVVILADAFRRLSDQDAEWDRCGSTTMEELGFQDVLDQVQEAALRGLVHRLGPLSAAATACWEHIGECLPPFWTAPNDELTDLEEDPLNDAIQNLNPLQVETLQSRNGISLTQFFIDHHGFAPTPNPRRKPYFEIWVVAHSPATRWEPGDAEPVLLWSGEDATSAILEWHKEHLRHSIPECD